MTGPALHHVSLIVSDTKQSLEFYCGLLGFDPDPDRPDLGFAGAWLRAGDNGAVHLLELPNPDPVQDRPEHGGRDRHVAFLVDDLDDIVHRLEQTGRRFTRSRSGRQALFCRDPDGNAIELIQHVRTG